MTALVLIAKQPIPGRVKTRLCPPLTWEQAARLASAAIDDTIEATHSLPVARRILLYDGDQVPPSARDFELLPQGPGTLDERLAIAFDAIREPRGELVRGVAMSRDDTGREQRRRLVAAGLRVGELATLVDVDTIDDAHTVAAIAPHSDFARVFREFAGRLLVAPERSG